MKGIDKITSRIIADAEAECRDVKRESDERCAAVRAENEKRAQDEYCSAWIVPPGSRPKRAC